MFYLVLLFTLLPGLAWGGDLNVPTIFLTERLMLFSFVLIVGLETWVMYKYLSGITKKQSLIISVKANLLTMFLIAPIVWGVWAALLFNLPVSIRRLIDGSIWVLIIISPWVGTIHSILLAEWIMAPVYFIASYYAEYLFSRQKLKDYPQPQVKKAFFLANLYSYLMIMLFETVYQLGLGYYKELHPEKWYLW